MEMLNTAKSVLSETGTVHLRLHNLVQQRLTPSIKIFVIGFNLCGTRSLHRFFQLNGIRSAHWGGSDPAKNYAAIMHRNIEEEHDILTGLVRYTAFSDLTFHTDEVLLEGCKLFKQMYDAYPKSLFILNTRPVGKWIDSKLRKPEGDVPGNSARRISRILGCRLEELPDILARDFESHHTQVVDFFLSKPTSKFCIFDVERDHVSKIIQFLHPTFKTTERYWGHLGKSRLVPQV